MQIIYHILALIAFFILGHCEAHISHGISPLWAFPWTLFLALPSFALGIYLSIK